MQNYPNLLHNGRIFPSWVVYKYKDYKIPTIHQDDEDICNKKIIKRELHSYQKFISKYLDYNSPFTGILLYHGVGSGKTATAIEVYNNLYSYSDQWNVFILLKASLKDNWRDELTIWLRESDKENRLKNIYFLSYDSPIADQQFQELIKQSDTTKKNLYIIDEVHNFIRNVYSNIVSQKGVRAQKIYDHILQERQENSTTRIILISATPIINQPYELALMFNLLRPNIFPKSEVQFRELFIQTNQSNSPVKSSSEYIIGSNIKKENINMFQRRILGLVSFYDSANPKTYAEKKIHFINITMPKYQQDIYKYYNEIETKTSQKIIKMKNKAESQLYKTFTRQACNFVFPTIHNIDGEHRPRPSQFNISETEAENMMKAKVSKGKKITGTQESRFMNKEGYLKSLKHYIDTFTSYAYELNDIDKKNKYTIHDDFKMIMDKFKKQMTEESTNNVSHIIENHIENEKTSLLFNMLYECSPKYICMILYISQSHGPVLMYSNYVLMEGIEIFKVYLELLNYVKYDNKNLNETKDYLRYAEFHGNIDPKIRQEYKTIYNRIDNNHGKLIKIIMISPAGTEGITLYHVRQIHITEPHWNEIRIEQMIGRGIRFCSHKYLPKEERKVDVYRYKVTFNIKESTKISDDTTDEYIEKFAITKENINKHFLTAIKESAIDCELNKENNILNDSEISKLKCFNFEESSLLATQVLPAYRQDILDDKGISSGTNSLTATTHKIKTYKINAVILIDIDKYSTAESYWLHKETGAVYDYKYKYLVGKLQRDSNNNFNRTNNEEFIIDHLVPYPGLVIK